MPTFDEYLSMLQPNPEQARKQAMWQALAGLGAGLLGGRNWQQGLSRGGLLAYDAMQGSQDRAAQDAPPTHTPPFNLLEPPVRALVKSSKAPGFVLRDVPVPTIASRTR